MALRVWFAVTALLSVIAMKHVSVRVSTLEPTDRRSFWWSPTFSVVSWRKRQPLDRAAVHVALRRLAVFVAIFIPSCWLYQTLLPLVRPSAIATGYLALVPFYLLVESLSALAALLFLASGWSYPSYLRLPILSRTIDEFWGRRWGTWVADWLRQVVLRRYRRRPLRGLCTIFVISGVWHEVIIDVPLYLFASHDVLGRWLLYFVVQAIGIAGERTVFRTRGALARVYTLAVVILPAPLALNEATLRLVWLY